ncbi:MAG: hypothetical protein IKE30_00545 [Clostridia bacterium]|nr:hypothetical protein [Clostridia bacterium]
MYLDPGFASMLIQIIIAAFAVCGAYLFVFKNKVKSLFGRKNPENAEQEAAAEAEAKAKVAALKAAVRKEEEDK